MPVSIAEVDAFVQKVDFSFLERDEYVNLGVGIDRLREDVVEFIYDELVPRQREIIYESDISMVSNIIDERYNAFLRSKIFTLATLRRDSHDMYGKCRERWIEAYFSFEDVVSRFGYDISLLTFREKFFGKYNLVITKNDKTYKVKLKAIDKVNRFDSDAVVEDDWLWVEITGVYGEEGWLYGGSDIIAFEREDSFLLIGTRKLRGIIDGKINRFLLLNNKLDILKYYIVHGKIPLFRRDERRDEIALVPVALIKDQCRVFEKAV